jgi:osmotically-inducible protein OsmY
MTANPLLKSDVTNESRWDPAAKKDDIHVAIEPTAERMDSEIAETVARALQWHICVPGQVQAAVENGWVTLTGCVKWELERSAAEDAVRHRSGIKGIWNDITLEPSV